jgi:hypothetical protein
MIAAHDIYSYDNSLIAQTDRPLSFVGTANILAFVKTARRTGAMRLFRLLALGAYRHARGLQRIMGATHVTFRFGNLLLWDCHDKILLVLT